MQTLSSAEIRIWITKLDFIDLGGRALLLAAYVNLFLGKNCFNLNPR
jgi:hypothetical protein